MTQYSNTGLADYIQPMQFLQPPLQKSSLLVFDILGVAWAFLKSVSGVMKLLDFISFTQAGFKLNSLYLKKCVTF